MATGTKNKTKQNRHTDMCEIVQWEGKTFFNVHCSRSYSQSIEKDDDDNNI